MLQQSDNVTLTEKIKAYTCRPYYLLHYFTAFDDGFSHYF